MTTLRVRLFNGDVRQGRFISRDLTSVTIYDGKPRRIKFRLIDRIDEVRPPYQACLTTE